MKFSNLWFELCAARRKAGENADQLPEFIQAHKDFVFAVTQAGLTFKTKEQEDTDPYKKGYLLSNGEEYNWDEPL